MDGAGRDHYLFCGLVGPVRVLTVNKIASFDHFPKGTALSKCFCSRRQYTVTRVVGRKGQVKRGLGEKEHELSGKSSSVASKIASCLYILRYVKC